MSAISCALPSPDRVVNDAHGVTGDAVFRRFFRPQALARGHHGLYSSVSLPPSSADLPHGRFW